MKRVFTNMFIGFLLNFYVADIYKKYTGATSALPMYLLTGKASHAHTHTEPTCTHRHIGLHYTHARTHTYTYTHTHTHNPITYSRSRGFRILVRKKIILKISVFHTPFLQHSEKAYLNVRLFHYLLPYLSLIRMLYVHVRCHTSYLLYAAS